MDITDQTSLASSSPEDAAQHIEKASIFNIEPTAYKNFKDDLNATADQLAKPTEAPPAVAGFMQQSSEHAALAVPDVEHLSYIERQANLISDYIFDRPTNEKKVINLANKKMHDPAAFTEDDQISLDNLNFERSQMAKNNYGLDGPIESLPAKVAGAISGMVRGTGDALENIVENPLHVPKGMGVAGFALKAGFGAAKAMYDSVSGSTYNELSNLQDENGKPLNIDEATKKGVSQGVGIVGTALQSVVGFGIMKTTPFLTKFINPSIARTIVEDPAMAAVKTTLLNIAGNASLMGGTAAVNAATSIVGEEIAKSYDGSEASFLNGITAAGERIKKNPSQVLEPALVGAATGTAIAGATGVAGFSATKSRFQAMSEFINENRQAGARDVTPQAQARIAGEAPMASGEHPIDVTPPEIGGGDPLVQATKAVQLREAMTNIGKVQDQTNMAKVSPSQLSSVTKMIFDKAGLSRVWMSAEDVNKFAGDDPKKSEAVRNLIDPSGVAAQQQNAPVSIEPHKFMELVKQYPEVMDLMRIDPEGPTPTQAESYLGNLETVHQKREALLKRLGVSNPSDIVDDGNHEFSGKLNVVHGSPENLTEFKAPEKVANNVRYDQGGGVFGKNTYFDQSGYWTAKDGTMETAGRNIHFKNIYGVELNLKKALIVTPKTLDKVAAIIGDTKAEDVPAKLKAMGYDGLVIKGVEKHVTEIESKFEKRNSLIGNRPGYDIDGGKADDTYWNGLSEQEKTKFISLLNQTKLFSKLKTGLNVPDEWQDQVVSFEPHKNATIKSKLGEKGQVTTKDIKDFREQNPNQAVIDQALTPVKNVGDKVAGGMDWHGDTLLLTEQEYLNQPTFSEAIKAVVPASEIAKYNEAQLKARTHVADQINDKANANLVKVQDAELQNQLEQQRQMELARLENDPNYEIVDRVQASLKSVKGTKNIGIYQFDPTTMTDAQLGKYLTNPQLQEYGIFRKGAGSIENAAQMAGVPSPDQFLDILANTPPRDRVVAARVAAAEATKAKDILDTVKMDETKLAKAFSDNTKNHIAEMKFMRDQQWPAAKSGIKRIALPLPKMEELTFKARSAVKSMKVKDLNIQQFKVGERASQRAAVNAILKNEVERAFMNKEAAALNSEFQKETAIAIGNVNKVFDFARRFNRPEIKAALKEAGPGYEKAVAEIFDVFRLDPSMRGASEKGSFQKWVQKRLAAGDGNFEIPERLSDVRQSANELTVAQLELVGDRLRAILHMAQWKNRLYSQHLRAYLELSKERALATEELVAADLHQLAIEHPDYKENRIPTVQGSKPAGEQVRGILATAQSLFNNLEHIVTTLDQEQVGGKWHDLLVKPIKGDGKYNGIMGESGSNKDLSILKTHLEKIIEAYGPKDFINLENTIVHIPEFAGLDRLNNGRLSKGELIGLMLNGGDPDGIVNRANLGVSNEIINKVLDRELDERDAVYAQSLLDTVGSYGERSAKLQLETTGQTVDLIKGVPFTHRGRSYPGGYWPQAYKVDFNMKVIEQGLKDRVAAVFGGKDTELYARQYAAEMTEQGRLQDRVGSKQALDLSMFRQARVFEEIIHDLNYRVPVRDTLKLLKNPSIRKDIVSIVGPEKYGVVTNTVVEAANRIEAENNNYFSDQNRLVKTFFGNINSGMSVGLLAANLSSIMIQPVSLVSTVQKMGMISGTKHLVNVLQKMARNPGHLAEFYEFAAEINPSIRNHMEGIEDSLTSTVHDLLPSRNIHKSMAPIRRAQEWMIQHAMEGMGMADQMIKTFGSLAAYGQYMAGDAEGFPLAKVMELPEAERHQAAMDYARQMSRTTLTHGAPSDKAPIQKLPLGSFFVKFWNDLRNVFNTTLSQTRKAKWQLQDMNAALGEGHTIPDNAGAMTAGKNAGAILMGMVVAATVEKIYEDYWRHKITPFDQKWDFRTAEGRAAASKYMSKYMMTAPPELFVESIPGFRDIKYGAEKIDERTDTRNAKVPLVKVGDDMATTYKALDDMLTTDWKTSFSPQQTKAMLFTLSYITGGFPVNAGYKALRWWDSNKQDISDTAGRIAAVPEQLGETIKKYVAEPPKGTSPETIAQLNDLNAQLNPQEKGIPPDTYDIIKNISSGGSWSKSNPANGAAGIYQFTDAQWKEISKAAPDLGLTENGRVSKDSGQQEKAMQFQTQANAKQLGAQDLPVDAETLYGAHILGAEKAVKLYQAAADAKLKTILKSEDFAAHPEFQNYKTVGQVRKLIKSQVNDKRLTLTDGKTED